MITLLPAGCSSALPEVSGTATAEISLLAAAAELLGLPELPVDRRGLSAVTPGGDDDEPPSSRTSSALTNTDGSALFTLNLLAIISKRRMLSKNVTTGFWQTLMH